MSHFLRLLGLLGLVVLLTLSWSVNNVGAAPDPLKAAAATISGSEMRTYIGFLASEEFQGRLTGQPGQRKAAELIAKAFSEFKLYPKGDLGGYHQYFNVPTNIVVGEPVVELILGDKTIYYELGEQYLFRGYTGSGDITAPICFVGYGITDENLPYDDYAGVDVTGKWALCLRGWQPHWPQESFDWANVGYKARNAYDHGAAGLILVGIRTNGTVEVPICSYLYGLPKEEIHTDFPMVHVAKDFAMDLFGSQGWYPPAIIEPMKDGKPNSFDFPEGIKAHVKVEANYEPKAPTANVIGYLPGSDANLASHAIVVCAHHDHVGYQPGVMFPGSDDNASGTVAMLAIARAASQASVRPKRSLLFISFTGEEMGLLGSKYFVEHPTWPLDKIDYVINLDMVGQGTTITFWGGTEFDELRELFESLAKDEGIEIENLPAYPVSDHGPFLDKDIKAVMLLGGGDKEYHMAHKPYVYKPEMINIDYLESVARITFLAAIDLAGR